MSRENTLRHANDDYPTLKTTQADLNLLPTAA